MDENMEKEIERIVSKKTKKFKIVIAVLMCLTITFGAFNFPEIRSAFGLDVENQPIINISYLNGDSTEGESGYGIRDNSGVVEIKNSGGQWGEAKKKLTTDPALTVDDSGGADYTTIQEAVDFFKGYQICCDATISVADGTYYEEVEIVNLDIGVGGSLTITGNTTTPSNVVIDGQNTRDYGIYVERSDVTIKGLKITGTNDTGLYVTSKSTVYADDVEIISNNGYGVRCTVYSFIQLGNRSATSYFKINSNGTSGIGCFRYSTVYAFDDNSGTAEIKSNTYYGMYADTKSLIYARYVEIALNGRHGMYADIQSQSLAYKCTSASGNNGTSGSYYGNYVRNMSFGRYVAASSNTLNGSAGQASPAEGTEGNNNSYMD